MEYMHSFRVSEEDRFFDSREEISSISDSGSDRIDLSPRFLDGWPLNPQYEVWHRDPESIVVRRSNFLKSMGFDGGVDDQSCVVYTHEDADNDRINSNNGAVSKSFSFSSRFLSSRSYVSNYFDEGTTASEADLVGDSHRFRSKNEENGSAVIGNNEVQNNGCVCDVSSKPNTICTVDEFRKILGFPLMEQFVRRGVGIKGTSNGPIKKKGWLGKLGLSRIFHRKGEEKHLRSSETDSCMNGRSCAVRVHTSQKSVKELSALHEGQEIDAHSGPILTMKFSPNGKYLASAGEDKIVRVWRVLECTRNNENQVQGDTSCVYLMLNYSSESTPAVVRRESLIKIKNAKKNMDPACVILPATVFKLSEKPVHEFHGHCGDVLDLAWSKSEFLISSSMDKTVRLWKVGFDNCIKIFSHNNYVTCVHFNPVDDNYFISGSIDGKVRIWAISRGEVVDWIDMREIVTAICYRPDGQGGIVGSMSGSCRFYDASGNHLELHGDVCLRGKKKYPYNRITGFEFLPGDPGKVLVTSADSQVRVIQGHDVICRYRGQRNSRNQMSAHFTSDGKHIVSASESNVHLWNSTNLNKTAPGQIKSVWSSERFLSRHLSIAIPWSGFNSEGSVSPASTSIQTNSKPSRLGSINQHKADKDESQDMSCRRSGLCSDILSKASATWPEDKLPTPILSRVSPATYKSRLRSLKSYYQNTISSSNAWGLVIVTAGWDGRIRSFLNYGLPIRF